MHSFSDGWAYMDVLVHEMAHAVYMSAHLATPQFESIMNGIFQRSKSKDLWRGTYGGGKVTELFVNTTKIRVFLCYMVLYKCFSWSGGCNGILLRVVSWQWLQFKRRRSAHALAAAPSRSRPVQRHRSDLQVRQHVREQVSVTRKETDDR